MSIIGHGRVLEILEKEAPAPSGAYMLVGASGVGKATVGRWFSSLVLCPTSGKHDGECRSCRLVEAGHHPDLVLVEPEGRQSIGVEVARSTVQQASLRPVESSRRVFLIEEAGNMTDQAANALLKTLEEPTRSTVFVLAVESESFLPATVASRCHTIHLGRVPEIEIVEGLVARGIERVKAEAVAKMAGGRPGLAINLADSPEAADFRLKWLGVPGRLTGNPGDAFLLADEMYESPDPLIPDGGSDDEDAEKSDRDKRRMRNTLLAAGLETLASWYGDSAAVQIGGPVRNTDIPVLVLTRLSPESAVKRAEMVLAAVQDLQRNLRPKLLLANLFVSLAE